MDWRPWTSAVFDEGGEESIRRFVSPVTSNQFRESYMAASWVTPPLAVIPVRPLILPEKGSFRWDIAHATEGPAVLPMGT